MGEDKKDLTNLMEYSKAMQDAGKAPPVPEGSIMEEQKIEKIDAFESLEDYSKSNPLAEPPPEAPAEPAAAPAAPPVQDPQAPVQEFGTQDFPVSESPASVESSSASGLDFSGGSSSEISGIPGLDHPPTDFKPEADLSAAVTGALEATGADGLAQQRIENQAYSPPEHLAATRSGAVPAEPSASDPFASLPSPSEAAAQPSEPAPTAEPLASASSAPPKTSAPTPAPEPSSEAPSGPVSASVHIAAGAESEPSSRTDPFIAAPAPRKAPTEARPALERLKQYSEHLNPGMASVPAAFPFSLLIEGPLPPEEREKLLDILSRENLGIREVDLEPQFESGKVLIPRISEYAGVMIVQALRATQARIRLGPSDTIFATADTRASEDEDFETADSGNRQSMTADLGHPAESIPVTTDSSLPGAASMTVVDVVTASAALKTDVVEAESSSEYQEVLEALQRELKYKAYRKGAMAVVSFHIQLIPLSLPTHYRMMVTGSAVRPIAPGRAAAEPAGPGT